MSHTGFYDRFSFPFFVFKLAIWGERERSSFFWCIIIVYVNRTSREIDEHCNGEGGELDPIVG